MEDKLRNQTNMDTTILNSLEFTVSHTERVLNNLNSTKQSTKSTSKKRKLLYSISAIIVAAVAIVAFFIAKDQHLNKKENDSQIAHDQAVSLHIYYYGNGNTSGEAPKDDVSYKKSDLITIKDAGTLVRNKHEFTGWNTSADGTGTTHLTNSIIKDVQGDIQLYAQWKKIIEAETKEEAPPKPAKAYQLNELIIDKISINEIVRQYGQYESYQTAFEVGNASTYLKLTYKNLRIILESTDNKHPLSFQKEDEGNGYQFGDKINTLTGADKNIKLKVASIFWNSTKMTGPRDIKIGDSIEIVKSKFLDNSSAYSDKKTVYKLKDVHPDYPVPEEDPSGARLRNLDQNRDMNDNGIPKDFGNVKADQVLEYIATNPPITSDSGQKYVSGYQYTKFYFKNDLLVAINQGYSPNEP